MGKKVEYFGLVFIMTTIIFAGIFVGNLWDGNVRKQDAIDFLREDSIIVLNGTVQEINFPESNKMILKINDKVYDISEYILEPTTFFGSYIDRDKLELLYYTLNVGDNITIFSSNRILINGEVFQDGKLIDNSVWPWTVISLVFFVSGIIILIFIFSAISKSYSRKYEIEIFEAQILDLKSQKETYKKKCKKLEDEKHFNMTKNSQFLYKPEELFCNECGSKLDLNNNVCQYCGNEVIF